MEPAVHRQPLLPRLNSAADRTCTALVLLALLGACSAASTLDDAPADTDRNQAVAAQPESSVRPGANTRFLDPELDVESFVKTFEGESREIAKHRASIVAELIRSAGLGSGADIADVGAGTGLFLDAFVNAVGPTGTVYAVDISPGFIQHLAQRADAAGWSQVRPILCAEDSVNLPARSLDLAFVCDTYHHFEYPSSTLASLYKALRPGGALVIVDFERIPGVTREWILEHVRLGREATVQEVLASGFEDAGTRTVEGLSENYMVVFRRPQDAR